MASRRRARQRALQILFIWDARRQPVEDAINAYYDTLYADEKPERDPFVIDLVRGTVEHLAEVDDRITRHAEHWRMERMPAVDRNILRIGSYELLWGHEVPDGVAISEAVLLAGELSTDNSPSFINGLLARLLELKPTLAL